jgi:hypothetical protein
MPFRYSIDKELKLVISTALDIVTFADVLAHQDGLLNDPDFNPQFNQFLDATRATALDISIDQAKSVARRPLFASTSRRAWVASNPTIFGMGRLIAAYNEMSSAASQIHIFYELSAALKWLGLEADPR